ncbi:MAG: hypothetical protein ACM3PY_17185 [Omnitrophica WOR_2 bacterium]
MPEKQYFLEGNGGFETRERVERCGPKFHQEDDDNENFIIRTGSLGSGSAS